MPQFKFWFIDFECSCTTFDIVMLSNVDLVLDIGHLTWNAGHNDFYAYITKTCLLKYIENFTSKNWNFSDKKKTLIFFIFLLKT